MPKPLHYPLFTGFNAAEYHLQILDTLAQAQRCSRAAAMRRLIEQAGRQSPPGTLEDEDDNEAA
jgi:hypothetical protein